MYEVGWIGSKDQTTLPLNQYYRCLVSKFLKLLLQKFFHHVIIFKSVSDGQLAQLVEQRTLNPWVQGSSP